LATNINVKIHLGVGIEGGASSQMTDKRASTDGGYTSHTFVIAQGIGETSGMTIHHLLAAKPPQSLRPFIFIHQSLTTRRWQEGGRHVKRGHHYHQDTAHGDASLLKGRMTRGGGGREEGGERGGGERCFPW